MNASAQKNMTRDQELDCLIFYLGGEHTPCATCVASKRCKALLSTNGFDIVGDLIDHLTTELPPGMYEDTDIANRIVDQILEPPRVLTPAEQKLADAISRTKVEDLETAIS